MGLFGGKGKGKKGKAKAVEDADVGTRRSENRKSRRIAAPSQGGQSSSGSNTRRTSRRIQSPGAPAPESTTPLQLESGADDVLDNSNFVAPGIADNTDEILLSSSSALDSKGSSVIGTSESEVAGISHSGDQPLLDFLIHKANMINEEQAEQMRQRAESQDVQVDVIGVKLEFFTEDELVNALTQECWVPHLKVDKYDIRKKALDTISYIDAVKFSVLPVDKLGGILNLAMVNPLDAEAIRIIESKTGLDIKKVVATRGEIDGGIEKYYGGGAAVASDESMNISQDLEPQRVTQMLNKVEEAPAAAFDDGIADIDDLLSADDIEDIDDLLGDDVVAPAAVAPAIIESISVDMDEIDEIEDIEDIEDIEVVEPAMATTSEDIELDDMDLELEEDEDIIDIPEIPAVTQATSPQIAPPQIAPPQIPSVDDISGFDLDDDEDNTDTDEVDVDIDLGGSALAEPAASLPVEEEDEFEPSIAVAKSSAKERPESMLKKDPATSRFKAAGKKATTKTAIVELTQVMEEEFQHAITHSKSHVFEKWSALQTRNRILNAVIIPKELDEMLSVLEENNKIPAAVA